MTLEAKITQLQLNSLPRSISERLLKRSDVVECAETGAAEIGGFGTFYFSDFRTVLATTELGQSASTPVRRDQSPISVLRVADGNFVAQNGAGDQAVLPELSLLDPSVSVRKCGYNHILQRSRPCWPRAKAWELILWDRTLDDSEFGRMLDETQAIGEPRILAIQEIVRRGRFGASDVVPTDRTYYESLIGPMSDGFDSVNFVQSHLIPHLKDVLARDPSWGLRCIQISNLDDLIDPEKLCTEISNEVLFSAFGNVGTGTSPQSVLTTYKLASQRSTTDPSFEGLASEALDAILRRASKEGEPTDDDDLYVALLGLSLSVIGRTDELCLAPPYWRRLAACAHAALMVDMIDFSGWNFEQLCQWCDSQRNAETGAMDVLDLVREPVWRINLQSANSHWVNSAIRAIGWDLRTNTHQIQLDDHHTPVIERLIPKFKLNAGLPGPLMGAFRRREDTETLCISLELLEGLKSKDKETETLSPTQVWTALVYSSRIYAFTEALRNKVHAMALDAISNEALEVGHRSDVLISICEVAAIQEDLELANLVARSVIARAPQIRSAKEATESAIAIVLASGANTRWQESRTWAEERLVELAYALPKGPCSAELAETIDLLQKFIPLRERRWSKVRAIAISAAD